MEEFKASFLQPKKVETVETSGVKTFKIQVKQNATKVTKVPEQPKKEPETR
jgi:hypothetical protein